jgi:oligopeptide/dipeptide ABC transporter ATP-binding protein
MTAKPLTQAAAQPLLTVDDLVVRFATGGRTVNAVNGVSFTVDRGETLAIVGESGSGKTVTMMAILGLLPSPPAEVVHGSALLDGTDLIAATADELRELRGEAIAMVFQDPMTSLNPVIRVGEQIREAMWVHHPDRTRAEQTARVVELLALVGVPQPELRAQQYPHEFSGGMRQRAMIAMAIANRPKLLVADEPTTALDVTIQAQVIEVLMTAKQETGAATILVTHDLGLVAEVADRVMVMYAGRIVERGSVDDIFDGPRHPYTVGLLASLPSIDARRRRLYAIPGQPPNMANIPAGCPFRSRCEIGHDRDRCALDLPALDDVGPGHAAACHYPEETAAWTVGTERRA